MSCATRELGGRGEWTRARRGHRRRVHQALIADGATGLDVHDRSAGAAGALQRRSEPHRTAGAGPGADGARAAVFAAAGGGLAAAGREAAAVEAAGLCVSQLGARRHESHGSNRDRAMQEAFGSGRSISLAACRLRVPSPFADPYVCSYARRLFVPLADDFALAAMGSFGPGPHQMSDGSTPRAAHASKKDPMPISGSSPRSNLLN